MEYKYTNADKIQKAFHYKCHHVVIALPGSIQMYLDSNQCDKHYLHDVKNALVSQRSWERMPFTFNQYFQALAWSEQ